MQIELQARGFDLTPSLRDHIARRLAQTLEHIRDDIKKVVVRISDDNGPRHGIDKRCMVRVALRGRKDVVVQDISGDMYMAIGHAFVRAAHSAKRLLRHRQQHRSVNTDEVRAGEIG
jgi:ribosomal subunit interface protein